MVLSGLYGGSIFPGSSKDLIRGKFARVPARHEGKVNRVRTKYESAGAPIEPHDNPERLSWAWIFNKGKYSQRK